MRIGTGGTCDGPNANAANIRSIFSYQGAPDRNPSSSGITLPTGCYDEQVSPSIGRTVPSASALGDLQVGFVVDPTRNNLVQWTVNTSALNVDWTKPTLKHAIDGDLNFNRSANVYTLDTAADTVSVMPPSVFFFYRSQLTRYWQWVYWVIEQAPTNPPLPHPIHLHGHDFWVIGQGSGSFSGSTSALTYENPIRRDSASLPARGYLVLAFPTDNPGAW